MLRAGSIADLAVLILMTASGIYYYRKFASDKVVPIRRIGGLDTIDEAIGRATEMGRPVHFTTGFGGLVADTFAAFAVLDYVARQCARYNARLIVSNSQPVVHPITENIVKTAYTVEGRPDSFKPSNIRYLSDTQQAYVSGVWGIMEREKAAANIMMGYFFAESLLLAECGNRVGAFQVAGTASAAAPVFCGRLRLHPGRRGTVRRRCLSDSGPGEDRRSHGPGYSQTPRHRAHRFGCGDVHRRLDIPVRAL